MVPTCWVACCARQVQRHDGHGLIELSHSHAACSDNAYRPDVDLALKNNAVIEQMARKMRRGFPGPASDQHLSDARKYLALVGGRSIQVDDVWMLGTLHLISKSIHQQTGFTGDLVHVSMASLTT